MKADGAPDQTESGNKIKNTDLPQNGEKGTGKSVPKPNKQSKKGDKSKLKEIEREEQLKLARSLINNLERKVNELENSNRILRRDYFMGGIRCTLIRVNPMKL